MILTFEANSISSQNFFNFAHYARNGFKLSFPLFSFSPIFGQFSKWIELGAKYTWLKVGENENISLSSTITEKTRKSGFWVPESITVWYEWYHHSYTMMMSHLWCQIKSLVLLDLETNKCWNRLCLLPSSSNVNVSLASPTVSLSWKNENRKHKYYITYLVYTLWECWVT